MTQCKHNIIDSHGFEVCTKCGLTFDRTISRRNKRFYEYNNYIKKTQYYPNSIKNCKIRYETTLHNKDCRKLQKHFNYNPIIYQGSKRLEEYTIANFRHFQEKVLLFLERFYDLEYFLQHPQKNALLWRIYDEIYTDYKSNKSLIYFCYFTLIMILQKSNYARTIIIYKEIYRDNRRLGHYKDFRNFYSQYREVVQYLRREYFKFNYTMIPPQIFTQIKRYMQKFQSQPKAEKVLHFLACVRVYSEKVYQEFLRKNRIYLNELNQRSTIIYE